MPINPPRPRTRIEHVQDAYTDTLFFFGRHHLATAYFVVGLVALSVAALAELPSWTALATGYVLAGLAILLDTLRGR